MSKMKVKMKVARGAVSTGSDLWSTWVRVSAGHHGVKTLGKFLTTMCLCSPSSISWYRTDSGDAQWLGVKAGMVHVGGR